MFLIHRFNIRRFIFLLPLTWVSCQSSVSKPVLPFYNSADFTPLFFTNADAANRAITHRVGSFQFLDQHHQLVDDTTLSQPVECNAAKYRPSNKVWQIRDRLYRTLKPKTPNFIKH